MVWCIARSRAPLPTHTNKIIFHRSWKIDPADPSTRNLIGWALQIQVSAILVCTPVSLQSVFKDNSLQWNSHHSAIKHLKALVKPYTVEHGGPLTMDHVTYVEGRGNLILGYSSPGASGTVGFVGSHFDVVPANPAEWERNPFELIVEVGCEACCSLCWFKILFYTVLGTSANGLILIVYLRRLCLYNRGMTLVGDIFCIGDILCSNTRCHCIVPTTFSIVIAIEQFLIRENLTATINSHVTLYPWNFFSLRICFHWI